VPTPYRVSSWNPSGNWAAAVWKISALVDTRDERREPVADLVRVGDGYPIRWQGHMGRVKSYGLPDYGSLAPAGFDPGGSDREKAGIIR
jgi:hypothetical protein